LHESKADPARAPRPFDQTAERISSLRSRLTAELRQAVRDGDFIYHYQPQFDLQNGQLVGVEALGCNRRRPSSASPSRPG
jgi:sensor c-di-GMP phosphodiesterase-like protein